MLEFIYTIFIAFITPIVVFFANSVIAIFKTKYSSKNKDYYKKRYEFYKYLYKEFYIKLYDSRYERATQINNYYAELKNSSSDDILFLSPKLTHYFLKNSLYLKKYNETAFKMFTKQGKCLGSLVDEIKKEYDNCCKELGYKTYRINGRLAFISFFTNFIILGILYGYPNFKPVLTELQYFEMYFILIVTLIISIGIFLYNSFYIFND